MRERLFHLSSAVLATGLSLMLLEVLLRWDRQRTQPIETRACRQQSSYLHHELIPGSSCRSRYPEWDTTFSVNSLGFRDREMEVDKPDGTFRILLIGDSFIEGEGVEFDQTASEVIERELGEESDRNVEVVNMGVMTYSPLIYARLLDKWMSRLSPDLVIVAVDMSDFQNDFSYARDLDEQGNFRNILFQQKMGVPHVAIPGVDATWKFWLRTHSVLYSEVADRIKQLVRRVYDIPEPTVFAVDDPASDPHFVTRSLENAGHPLMWKQFGESMEKINTTLKQSNIPWLAIIYPYGHQAATDEWEKGRIKNGFKTGVVYPTSAAELLSDFAVQRGFRMVNLLPVFRQSAVSQKEFLYYPYDGHFTPKGHWVLAQALKEVIRDYLTYGR